MSEDGPRPRNVKFVDVTARDNNRAPPAWLSGREERPLDPEEHVVSPLSPPEVPSHPRPALAPLLESVRPPARPPSQFPRPPSQFPGPHAWQPPGAVSAHPSQPPPAGLPSVLPGSITPSQSPGSNAAALASQFPGPGEATPEPHPGGRERRRDTLVEDLVPRAEEEAVLGIQAALERFAEERAQALEHAEKELVELVRVICRRVLLREVSLSSTVIEGLVQEGLTALGSADRVTVKLGPFFADALSHISDNLHHRGIKCSVSIDHEVGSHGCVIETELGRVDESVETRLAVLLASLDTVP